MTGNYTTAADLFDQWRDDLLTGKPPTRYPVGTGFIGGNLAAGTMLDR